MFQALWIGSLVAVAVAWFVISLFNERLAFDIARSFGNGEASIGFWMSHGISFFWAIGIGIACSTYDTFNWLCLFRVLKNIYPRSIKPLYERIYGEQAIMINAETPWPYEGTLHRQVDLRILRSAIQPDSQRKNLRAVTLQLLCATGILWHLSGKYLGGRRLCAHLRPQPPHCLSHPLYRKRSKDSRLRLSRARRERMARRRYRSCNTDHAQANRKIFAGKTGNIRRGISI